MARERNFRRTGTSGFSVVDFNPQTGRFEQRAAGRGAYYGVGAGNRYAPPERMADTFGRGTPKGYGGGGGFGEMAGKLGRLGGRLLPIAGLALQFVEWWFQNAQQSDNSRLNFPPGWQVPPTGQCDRGQPRQRYWGVNDGVCTGVRNFAAATENTQVLAGTGATRGWYVHVTRATGDAQPGNPFFRNVRGFLPQPTGTTFPADKAIRHTRVVPASSAVPFTDAPPAPEWRVRTYPRPFPDVEPATYFGPKTPGGVKGPPIPHVPPQPNNREKKGLVFNTGKVGKAYGALTEFRDFADCLSASIPGQPCRKYRNQLHKYAACIAEHHADVNMPEAIACFYGAQAKDTAIGRPAGIFQRGASKGPYWTRPVGPGAGGWATPRSVGKLTPI